jgi:hypothetical protein
MIKTQIQLPDALYRQLKNLASDREWSLAETLRRSAEMFLATQPASGKRLGAWKLPAARHGGAFRSPETEWTELAHGE